MERGTSSTPASIRGTRGIGSVAPDGTSVVMAVVNQGVGRGPEMSGAGATGTVERLEHGRILPAGLDQGLLEVRTKGRSEGGKKNRQ